jgi:hypothetical protein
MDVTQRLILRTSMIALMITVLVLLVQPPGPG